MKRGLTILLVVSVLTAYAQPKVDTVGTITATRQTTVHDPVMIQQGDTYYLFCTGWGISFFSSKDLKNWKKEKPVFAAAPQWAVDAIPSFRGHIWAPDISFHNGKYYLYYAVSAFGKNTSCIGLAINRTLDPVSPDYKWEDLGKVIQSVPGRDMWNAIDANEIDDEHGNHWMTFGSFWNGIKLVKLNNDLITVAQPEEWYTIASRPRDFNLPDTSAGNAAIEAPFIIKKDTYYYLFVSWDYCCRGEKSDYKVVMGRSSTIKGPYLDKNGLRMTLNGGSLVVQGDNKEWFGAGHNAVCKLNGKYYIVYHGYDAKDKGKPKLIIDELEWDNEGWPKVMSK
jgi:arabinan endo-1,5-alpha-L-arabinosidase